MQKRSKNGNYTAAFMYIVFISAGIIHTIGAFRAITAAFTPYFLFAVNGFVLYILSRESKKILLFILSAFIFTFATEIIGVKTGILYGHYAYSGVLGIGAFGVPFIIGLNWVLITVGSYAFISDITENRVLRGMFAAFAAVYLDLFIEPAAVSLNYWQWSNGVIPLKNYLTWFLVVFAAASAADVFGIKIKTSLIRHYLANQYIFFIILYVFGIEN